MRDQNKLSRLILGVVVVLLVAIFGAIQTASAHCDAIDGPVVTDARSDLDSGELDLTLKWISADHEEEVESVFQLARQVMDEGPEARQLAERYFFETVVRVHRETEGEPYTGLKPEGYNAGPIVAGVDEALESGSIADVEEMVQDRVSDGISERFADALAKKAHSTHNAEAGRSFVHSYVELMHYIEHLHDLAGIPSDGGHEGAHNH